MSSIVVIGGGVTGLSAAYHLQKKGLSVRLLEAAAHTGGAIRTFSEEGFLYETGPNTLQLNNRSLLTLIEELGLKDEMVEASLAAKNRFVIKDGAPCPVPMSPPAFFKTSLFTTGAKFRLFAEPFVGKKTDDEEESLASFVRRRLGPEPFDYGADPFVSGIYAGNPEKLSLQHGFPRLCKLEQEHGSLFRGGMKAAKAKKKDPNAMKMKLVSFRQGMGAFPDAFHRQLGDAVHTEAEIESIEKNGSWTLRWKTPQGQHEESFDTVLLTIPAFRLSSLPFPQDIYEDLAVFDEIEYPPVTVLAQGYNRDQIDHPLDGFGMLAPSKEGMNILGTLFSSTFFPGRAPDGQVLMTTFIGGARNPDIVSRPVEELHQIVREDHIKLLGVRGEPHFLRHIHWPKAIPQYNIGYGRFLRQMEDIEKKNPGLLLAGNYRGGIAAGQCILNGTQIADTIAAS